MQPNQLSSGDVIADRRADYARMLCEGGEPAGAAELMEQALELVPGWAAGWFRLGDYREKAGDPAAAIAAMRQVLALDPQDIFGARLRLALLGGMATPERPPSRYVERLFDDYADRFDTALVEKLSYSVPQKLAALVRNRCDGPHIYRHGVDLGCGTGLFGVEIRKSVAWLEGFDLSANMLGKAAGKAVYDHLAQADLSLGDEDCGLFCDALPPHRADLVSAADVLMYLGGLDNVFALAASLAAPSAAFAFSVEDAGTPDSFHLAASLRYAHSETYVCGLLKRYGFALRAVEKTVIRMDAGKPVRGILFLAEKSG